MSTATTLAPSPVMSVTLYWRATHRGEPLPVHLQSWWYMTRFDDSTWQDHPVPVGLLRDVDSMADVVVLLAELHGHYIDSAAVRNFWAKRSAVWVQGS